MTSSQFKLEQDYSWFYHSNMLAFANFGIYNDGETDTEGADDISKNRKIDCVEILIRDDKRPCNTLSLVSLVLYKSHCN